MHVAKYSRADRELDDPNNLGHLYSGLYGSTGQQKTRFIIFFNANVCDCSIREY